ncbi:MAG: ankyrin repeat domain-containing protein [Kiritimatiellia bacterium]
MKIPCAAAALAMGSLLIVGCSTSKITTADGKEIRVECDNPALVQQTSSAISGAQQKSLQAIVAKKDFARLTPAPEKTDASDQTKQSPSEKATVNLVPTPAEIDRQIRDAAPPNQELTDNDMVGLRKLYTANLEQMLEEFVYKPWIESLQDEVSKKVKALVAEGKFEEAREVVWNAPLTPCEPVNTPVRKFCIDLLRTEINPVQWRQIEKNLRAQVAAGANKPETLETVRAAILDTRPVRAYSKNLDRKLLPVLVEASKLGVGKEPMRPVVSRTRELLIAAANLVDETDQETDQEKTKGADPKLDAYELELEAYYRDLTSFDCTADSASNVTNAVDTIVRPLILSASKGDQKGKESATSLSLGITALNKRLERLKDELLADVDQRIKDRDIAIDRQIKEKDKTTLEAEVRRLVDGKQYGQAREHAWKAAAEKPYLRELATRLISRLVNIRHWRELEPEIDAKTKEFIDAKQFNEARAWLQSIPKIRTCSISIDQKLDAVGVQFREAGMPPEKVDALVQETQKVEVELARLADYTDTLDLATASKAPIEQFHKALEEYRAELIRNDCTEANADHLIEMLLQKAEKVFPSGNGKTEAILGCNAFNARLNKCITQASECVSQASKKASREKADGIISELVKQVVQAVKEKRFAEARALIRDVPLVGDALCDTYVYAARIGLLNSLVNPAQKVFLLEEIDQTERRMLQEDKWQELLDWVKGYALVRDIYGDISKALDGLVEVAEVKELREGSVREVVEKLRKSLRELLDKREGSWSFDVGDCEGLARVAEELERALRQQYFEPEQTEAIAKRIQQEILEVLKRPYKPLTTWELNAILSQRLLSVRETILRHKAFCDNQVALAEGAIAAQLGKAPGAADCWMLNAVLGDYARAMRIRKVGGKLDQELLDALVLGAVCLNSPTVLECALARDGRVDCVSDRDPCGRTPLLVAIQLGRIEMVSRLLKAKARCEVVDARGNGVLHYAIAYGNLDLVWEFLNRGCDLNLRNKAGETPLFAAVRRDQKEVIKLLVSSPDPKRVLAKVGVRNGAGMTPFDVACAAGARDSLDVLAEAGSEFGCAQLVLAVKHGRLAIARWLVNRGVDVNGAGVMATARTCSDVKRYLVSQGGIALPCDGECCNPKPTVPAQAKCTEATGSLEFKVKEVK